MAVNANSGTVRLTMKGELSDLVQQLDSLNPDDVSELVLRNCLLCKPAELYKQISRCARLRRLSCVACALQPSALLKLMLERLKYLQQLELSLVQDTQASVDYEIDNICLIGPQMCDVIRYHSLRRLYVEVGGDHNFELLSVLLVFCPNITELHVHFVRGTFSNGLAKCQQLHEQFGRLETFTFTSEVPDSVPLPNQPDPLLTFANYAAICGNVCHDKSHHWWSCVELGRLARRGGPSHSLPSQLVVFSGGDSESGSSLLNARIRHSWTRVRKLCLLLLPQWSSKVTYPRATLVSGHHLGGFFSTLENVVELNVSSFHCRQDVIPDTLLHDSRLGSRLLALSVPPCWFPTQSSVRRLLLSCPILRDLDVRVVTREDQYHCASCDAANTALPAQGSSDAPLLSSSITRLTLCDVNYRVLPLYFEHYRAASTLRLAGWRPVGMTHYDSFFRHLAKFIALRCLVLQNEDLPLNDQHFMASLSLMPSLEHLCLLTSTQISDAEASQCVRAYIGRSAQLKCAHVHYGIRDAAQRRITALNGPRGVVLLRRGPCFACCSTATFIGLVKPINRDCELGM